VIIKLEEFFNLRKELPTVDVRSEGEFAEGHIRGAANIPLLNNAERVVVGTDYKQKGQQEAIKSGFRLVGPRIIDIVQAAEEISAGNEMLVHCWRGGMRSSNFCQFLGMARIKTHQLAGGYKAYRQKVISSFETPLNLKVIAGFTGSGKSEILNSLADKGEQIIDLEKLANHKGSAFGGLMMPPQPTTEQFQNNLFEKLQELDLTKRIWIEDESITIGRVVLPDAIWRQMATSDIVEVDVEKETRIRRLVNEYGHADKKEFQKAMTAIAKKLGGQHFQIAKEKLVENDMAAVIDILLTYYDKAYRFGLSKKEQRVKTTLKWDGKSADAFAEQLRLL
jgi:tRNA 2-selenouridine synthase